MADRLPDISLSAFYPKMFALYPQYGLSTAGVYRPEHLIPDYPQELEFRGNELRRALAHALEDDQALWPLVLPAVSQEQLIPLAQEAVRRGRACKTVGGKHFYLALSDFLLSVMEASYANPN